MNGEGMRKNYRIYRRMYGFCKHIAKWPKLDVG